MQRRYGKFFLGIVTAVCAAAVIGCGTNAVKDEAVIMEIAGQPVVSEEYQMILKKYSSQVKMQYDTEAVNADDFWSGAYEEGEPLSQIMELAEEDLRHKKTLAKLAGEAGIEQETDYLTLMQEAETRNSGQKSRTASGEYGLTSFEPMDYYQYVYTGLETQVLEEWKQKHTLTQEDLKKQYEAQKEQYISDVRVEMLTAELRREAGEELAEQIREELSQGKGQKELSDQYPDVNFYEITMSTLNTQEGKSGAYTQRWLTASAMAEGEVCVPFAIGDHILVMRCLDRQEQAAEPFEELEGIIESQEQTRLAREDISREEQEAEVVLKISQKELKEIAKKALE